MSDGQVYLVGAGPGAYDLITLRGMRALREADVVISDDLVPSTFMDDLGILTSDKLIIHRTSEEKSLTQDEINNLICDYARQGKTVVRLKIGDPFVFGRGSDELEYITSHGFNCTVIPGLSSSTAVPGAIDYALTKRDERRSFAVTSAVLAGGKINKDFPKADSLIVLMAVGVLDKTVDALMQNGWSPDTPAEVLERISLPWERRIRARLADIANLAKESHINPPGILIVGKTIPLEQTRKRVLFTGMDPAKFRVLGELLHWPALKITRDNRGIKEFPEIIRKLERKSFGSIIFNSRPGARLFFRELVEQGKDNRILADTIIAAGGHGTAAILCENNISPDIVSGVPGCPEILEAVSEAAVDNILFIQGSQAPGMLSNELAKLGKNIQHLTLYKAIPHPDLGRPLPEHDVIYFVSPSGVEAYWETYGEAAFAKEAWCIGAVTLDALKMKKADAKIVNPYNRHLNDSQ